jgi:predicted DNA-binding transcriptional regulator YafY
LRGGLALGRSHVLVDVDPWMRSGEPVPSLPLVHDGLLRGRRLELDYRDSEGERRRLTVDPAGLVAKAGTWYLVTTEPALLRVSRIDTCTVLPQAADRPVDFDLAAAWGGLRDRVEVRPRDLPVVLRVEPSAAAMVRRLLARHVRPTTTDGDTVYLAFSGVQHAVGSLLGLGTRVEVLDPPALRAAMLEAAQALVTRYTPPPDANGLS